jgi:hypothetical protein
VEDASSSGFYRTRESVVAKAVGDDFSFSAILLCGQSEGQESVGMEIAVRASDRIDSAVVDVELDIGESESGIIRYHACAFDRAGEKIKGDGDEVGNGVTVGSGGRC